MVQESLISQQTEGNSFFVFNIDKNFTKLKLGDRTTSEHLGLFPNSITQVKFLDEALDIIMV